MARALAKTIVEQVSMEVVWIIVHIEHINDLLHNYFKCGCAAKHSFIKSRLIYISRTKQYLFYQGSGQKKDKTTKIYSNITPAKSLSQ